MSGSNLHTAWARLFLRAAASAGVRDVVLSPGSRSTPLALAAAESGEVRCHVIVDERSAGFFALGQARASGRPSMLICTSGTAGAHYFPAIIEASQSFLPLVVVTADRPWELQAAAAPQTIDQIKLYGGHVRSFTELGLPDASPVALRAVARAAAQAVVRSVSPEPGPVHVNARFRKPLEPVLAGGPEPWEEAWKALMEKGAAVASIPRIAPDPEAISTLVERCARAERGLIVCGPLLPPSGVASAAGKLFDLKQHQRSIASLARATGFPVLAEATSQARFGVSPEITSIAAFDALLRDPALRAELAPDLLIEIGSPPTSQGYADLVAERPGCPRFVLALHGWNDPSSSAHALLFADPADVCEAVAARLPAPRAGGRAPWIDALARADARAWSIVERELSADRLSEGSVARLVVSACPEGSILAIGNSSPVRDLDMYCPASPRGLRVLHQRGASGIDGLVSGAAGARSVAGGPVTLLLGDLSLLHDLTGLALAREAAASSPSAPLVIVVVQNDGGRIFERLPIGRAARSSAGGVSEDQLERCFTTPQSLAFEPAAAMFGLAYERVETRQALEQALAAAHARSGATLIEAVVPKTDGAERAARLLKSVAASREPAESLVERIPS
ncbi:MAG TPA: 2-succinyl-5-enolpyruvyl-6-hydroxy-3-cyclohexene-1-carboxylic-acid synthase [Polyangiaceae bacterium]|jgi:2-succinyl-5-enolpyruvyl-6-hydroxy-3-cyclohexene-1-carboxylate synthase|nr:2-succinyl-5-enolpyruvyl-6-hydroxy-3-cyclohexene-1-carboxylic-acid synthase [Polyangiaceae bacterium]